MRSEYLTHYNSLLYQQHAQWITHLAWGPDRVAVGYSVEGGGLLEGPVALAVPDWGYPLWLACCWRWGLKAEEAEGALHSGIDSGELVWSIFHGQIVVTVGLAVGTSSRKRLNDFLYQTGISLRVTACDGHPLPSVHVFLKTSPVLAAGLLVQSSASYLLYSREDVMIFDGQTVVSAAPFYTMRTVKSLNHAALHD